MQQADDELEKCRSDLCPNDGSAYASNACSECFANCALEAVGKAIGLNLISEALHAGAEKFATEALSKAAGKALVIVEVVDFAGELMNGNAKCQKKP